jgi:predicted anti-sigma-YlaC factor YlaD
MDNSDCDRIFALLSEYLDQELAPATCEKLELHLSGCPECIEFLQSLKRSRRLCHQLGKSIPVPPLDQESMAELRGAYEAMLVRRRNMK